ncbi:hypothetical protein ON010_g18905 [Phytophthora cinnamomi]|nr:hypothetical protein ON010_g18905 [Phytophthora cinnamomi]
METTPVLARDSTNTGNVQARKRVTFAAPLEQDGVQRGMAEERPTRTMETMSTAAATTSSETTPMARTTRPTARPESWAARAVNTSTVTSQFSTKSGVTTGARTKPTPQHVAGEQRSERYGGDERRVLDKQTGSEHDDDGQLEQHSERVQRRAVEPTLQLTDDEISDAQTKIRLVRRMVEAGEYRGQKVTKSFGLVVIETQNGQRVILPPVPGLRNEVKRWGLGCQECGSRATPREVIPPLRSIRGGDVGDRWALDVAGHLPTTSGGERYVIAAVEYVTRYAVAMTVKRHTAENVAAFLMKNVVLKFGAFREILTDGALELTGKVIEQLVIMLQAQK